MAPNVTLHFFPANDVNGSVLHEITDEDTYFRGLTLKPERDGLGGAELLLARRVGFAGFGTGTFFPEVFVRAIVHAYSDTTYYPWGFFLTKRQQVVVAKLEDGEEVFRFGGPGPKQYLDRGVLGIGSPSTGWNLDLINGVWRWTDAATVGRILGRIKNQDSTEDDPALPDLTLNFDDSDDSASVAWADTDLSGSEEQYQIPIGTSFLQALWDLDDLIELDSWVDLGTVATPKFELNVRQGLGADKTGTSFGAGVCLLREGENIANDSLEVEGISLRKASHVIVEGAAGKWAEAERPSFSPGDYVKREKIEYTRSQSVYWLEKAGLRWLKRQDYGERELTVQIVPGASDASGLYFPAPNRNLWLSNIISVDTSADGTTHTPLDINASEDQLVTGFELALHEAGDTANSDRKAKSWDVKVVLNRERAGTSKQAPDQTSAATGGTCTCGGPQSPPHCSPVPPDAVETELSSTENDPADWAGTTTSAGSCWGGVSHESMGGSGGSGGVSTVAPGDLVYARVEFREQTGDDSWENVDNYAYVADLVIQDSTPAGDPEIRVPIVHTLYHNAGCINVTHEIAYEIPAGGYDNIRIEFRYRLGGIRYRAWLGTLTTTAGIDCPPFSLDPSVPSDSPYWLPSDTIEHLIANHTHPQGVIEDSITNELDDTLVLAPDGAGGVEFRAEAGGGGGAPTTADYLVGTAQGGLSAEIVVGTTPGGELGGTWASPTVDASHSGSSHAGVIAAHEALTDPHTGYRLESADHSHASTGLQGGTVAHSVLTGVTANQHHNEDHQSRHNNAGADALKLDDLATPDDNTDLDASTSRHGLLKKLPGGTSTFLRADGTFANPGGGSGGSGIDVGRPFVSGFQTYVLPGHVFGGAPAAGALGTGNRYYLPIIVTEELELVSLMAECTSGNGAGRAMRGGLYEASRDWIPDALVLEGAYDCSTTGVKLITPGSPITLPVGRYLLVNESNHASTVMRLWQGSGGFFAMTGGTNVTSFLVLTGSTYGALPDPCGAAIPNSIVTGSTVGPQTRQLLKVNV